MLLPFPFDEDACDEDALAKAANGLLEVVAGVDGEAEGNVGRGTRARSSAAKGVVAKTDAGEDGAVAVGIGQVQPAGNELDTKDNGCAC